MAKNRVERRCRRSTEPLEAVHLQLLQVVREFSMEVCAVSDREGRVVAASCPGDDRWLAFVENREARRVAVQEFYACGRPLYMVALGEPSLERDLGVLRAVMGVRRIWKHGLAAA